MHEKAINEFWKNHFKEQSEISAEMSSMTVKEYFETCGVPDEAEIFAAVFRAGKHTERLSEIKVQILQIDRKALGRYLIDMRLLQEDQRNTTIEKLFI